MAMSEYARGLRDALSDLTETRENLNMIIQRLRDSVKAEAPAIPQKILFGGLIVDEVPWIRTSSFINTPVELKNIHKKSAVESINRFGTVMLHPAVPAGHIMYAIIEDIANYLKVSKEALIVLS